MYAKFIWIALIIAVLPADGKKSRNKNSDEIESTPQPNMVSYSTFGFKDVGSYDGFVPSSPDFNNYHNNREPQMKLYAPAFPSSIDSTGLGSYYEPMDQSPFDTFNEDQNIKTFEPIPMNFFTSSSDSINAKRNEEAKEIFELNDDNSNLPTYGTKLSSKARKPASELNNTDYNILDSISSVIENNYRNDYNSNVNVNVDSSHQTQPIEGQNNINYPSLSSSVSFPKVVDFTSAKKYYPTSVESKYTTLKPIYLNVFQNNEFNDNDDNKDNGNVNEHLSYKTKFNGKDGNDFTEKDISPVSFTNNQDAASSASSASASYPNVKNSLKMNKYKPEYKDKVRIKHIKKNNDDHSKSRNPIKGYEYSTNYSTASFHYDYDKPKRQFNSSIDEILPESSSLNFVSHRYPDKDFTGIKTLPSINFNNENSFSLPDPDTYKPSEDYLNAFKSYYSAIPSTPHWGNLYKQTEFSSTKKQPKKPYLYDDDNEEIVHIPKRPHSSKHGNYFDSTSNDWYSNDYKSHSPSVTKQPEWPKDFIRSKFKTDEDLLGLRNQDDLSASYLQPSKYNDLAKDFDFDKLSEKWRQSYLKSNRDYENYASDTKEIHIPRPKPYSIEVPHPVIVPVPQPYPVKVPIPKPVAIPVIRELKVPIEKPMPYPVFKKVPYIVERLVPVPVEKQVRVPVAKPYPVHVPQVRPVFHHSKYEDEDEYEARPDTRRPVYKRHKNSRNRPRPTTRRPPRMAYRDHQKRHPTRRPSHNKRPRRPNPPIDHSRYEDFEDSDSDFERYCKRTGKC